jgi:hypothetical protein
VPQLHFFFEHLTVNAADDTPQKVQGVIHLDSRQQVGAFKDKDLALVRAIANQTSIAIENTMLLKRVEREATMIGQLGRFLPPPVVEKMVSLNGTAKLSVAFERACTHFSPCRHPPVFFIAGPQQGGDPEGWARNCRDGRLCGYSRGKRKKQAKFSRFFLVGYLLLTCILVFEIFSILLSHVPSHCFFFPFKFTK